MKKPGIKSTVITLLTGALVLCQTVSLPAQSVMDKCSQDAMLVFDGSTSMAELGVINGLERPRIEEARQALRQVMPQITPFRRVGLIVYGPGNDARCRNIDLRLRPTTDAANLIIAEVDNLMPDGNTPLTRAVRDAAEVLNYREKPGTVVLITDGKENCGGETCDMAAEFAQRSAGLTVHVIGFQVRDQKFSWNTSNWALKEDVKHGKVVARCLADETGGKFVSTETVDELMSALRETMGCPLFGRVEDPDPSGTSTL